MQALLHSVPPNPATAHCWPIPSLETSGHSQANLGQSLVGSLVFSLLIYKMSFTHLWNLQFWWSHYYKLMRWYMWKQLENAKCFNKIQCLRKSLITLKSDEKSSWFHWHLGYNKGGKTETAQPMASGRWTVPNQEMDSLLFPQQGRQEEFSRDNPGGQDTEAEKGITDASRHF